MCKHFSHPHQEIEQLVMLVHTFLFVCLLLYSPYQLTVSETHSTVTLYNGRDLAELSSLANVPLRPLSDYYTLNDVFTNGQSLDGSHINLLAVIRNVGAAYQINMYTSIMSMSGHRFFIIQILLFC